MKSLKARLGLGLALSLITLFTLQWFAVTYYMRSVVEGYAISRLSHDMDNILAGVSFTPAGALEIRRESVDAMYHRPFSGHYYIVSSGTVEPLRSRSLWDTQLEIARPAQGRVELAHVNGPSGQALLALSGGFVKSGRSIVITVGEDISSIESRIEQFRARYAVGSLTALAVLIALQALIVRAGLAPLAKAKDDLAKLERGEADSISEDVPTEALPLVREINRLLNALRERLRRSRESAGNMAHALKTPLSALRQILESDGMAQDDGTRKRVASHFTAIMQRMERELSRARLAGANTPGRMFDAQADIPDIVATLEKIYREKNLTVTWGVGPGSTVPMDREDALELVGVLMDNACKWAVKRVHIGVHESARSLLLMVEDDGPGLPEEGLAKIARRGVRLDEAAVGHGLGLSIASDIVESYSGTMEFGRSERLKGFEVRVKIPKAVSAEHGSANLDASPRVGVSACLLGQNTRYDGSNRLDPVIAEIVGAVVELVPVCPEMEIGSGSPRPPIRLVDGPEGLRARGVDDPAVDVTDALSEVGRRQTGLRGFVLKGRSPSCGAGDADVFSPNGGLVSPAGYGVFARSIMDATPLLPVADETALRDMARRNVFLLMVFIYDRWMSVADGDSAGFDEFLEKTDFARNALDGETRQYIDSLAGRAQKDGGTEARQKYAAAFLTALRDAPAEGAVRDAADRAISFLALRKQGNRIKP